jgi:hypothetical protein
MTIIKHRDICGLVGTLCGACIRQRLGATSIFMLWGLVGTLCGSGSAQAQQNFSPLPPQVGFISNGKYTGTLQIQGLTLPITGTLAYLAGGTEYLHISVNTEGMITSDTWQETVPTVINEWEILSIFPTTCVKEVLSGTSFPQCTAWSRNTQGMYSQECTVTAQGNKATLDRLATLSGDNKLVNLQENATININEIDVTASINITMTEQGTTPPTPSDFNRPGICPAPSGTNQAENDNTHGNPVGLACTGTIPNICF